MPSLPTSGISVDELKFLSATRDNINNLIGANGNAPRAILRGEISVAPISKTNFNGLTAKPGGYIISSVQVAGAVETNNLMQDVQNLANDVAILRSSLNALLTQLKV